MNRLLTKFKKNKKDDHFLSRVEHQWFFEFQGVSDCFDTLYRVSNKSLKLKEILNKTLFIQSSGQYACATTGNMNIIIIFPELTYLMKTGHTNEALSILLHELGHIILEHQTRGISNDQAQVEADLFSAELGYGKDLYNFLLKQSRSSQIEKRLTALKRTLNKEMSSYPDRSL